MLTHKNILSNVLQVKEWLGSHLKYGEDIAICALPLYHIFALTCNSLTFFNFGAKRIHSAKAVAGSKLGRICSS